MKSLYESIKFYNEKILEKGQEAIRNGKKSFEIVEGKIPIIISAPHCVNQTREGKIKGSEGETGAIAQYVAEKTKCYAIYKTYNNNDDANYDIKNNPYKEAILELAKENKIKILLDLHGAAYKNKFDIELGTAKGKNIEGKEYLVEELKQNLENNGINNITIDSKFMAISEHTISRSISKKAKIPCIQLEINGRYRYIQHMEGIEKLTKALIEFVNNIKII